MTKGRERYQTILIVTTADLQSSKKNKPVVITNGTVLHVHRQCEAQDIRYTGSYNSPK